MSRGPKGEKRPRPFWVNHVVLARRPPIPDYPDQRTCPDGLGLAASCQKRTHARELDRLRRR